MNAVPVAIIHFIQFVYQEVNRVEPVANPHMGSSPTAQSIHNLRQTLYLQKDYLVVTAECALHVWVSVHRHVTQCKLTPTSLLNTPLLYWRIWLNRMLKRVLISPQPDQQGNKLQRQKISSFIYPIYNHDWRNISTIYIYIYIYIYI